METPTGKLKYRNPFTDNQDQILFFGLFMIGTIGILTLKMLDFGQITITILPICLMIIYTGIALVTKRYRLREDRVGDNIYYLGFLYTLVSLAYALFAYKAGGSAVEDIITNFGIAIFTTIFGLAGRVLFNQMREDPVEYEREARYSLAEATSALRSQLAEISMEVSSFKRKLMQIMEEGIVDISSTAKSSMAETVKQFASTADEVIKSIQAVSKTFTDHSHSLNVAASKNVEALQALFMRIENIEASPELLSAKFDPVIQKFDEVASEAMKRNRAQANDLKRVRDMIDTAIAASELLHVSLAALDKIVSQKTQTFVQSFDSAIKATASLTETLRGTASALLDEIAAAKSVSAELNRDVVLHRTSFSQLRSAMEVDLKIAQQHREAMSRLATESHESVQALQGALVSLSKTLVEQLGER